jgi:hypothetical protein
VALSAIFADVKAQYLRIRPGEEWLDGGEHLAANHAPPRVVWVPNLDGEDTYGPPEVHDLTPGAPRTLLECTAQVAIHLWGKDPDTVEAMRNAVIVALRRSAAAAHKVVRGWWLGPARTVMQAGRVYVLIVTFPIPIRDVETFATVTDVPGTATDPIDLGFDPPPAP